MEASLDPIEIRVIGALIEKQVATPEYYPLTLNSLVAACNQTTNRDPVTSHDESAIGRALASLRQKGLTWTVTGGRAPKYEHRFGEKFQLAGPALAVMCVLMLRGPQTAGEIRGRTGRLCEFAGLEEVETVLASLMGLERPLAIKLARLPGTKEPRYAHQLGGDAPAYGHEPPPPTEASVTDVLGANQRIVQLENEMAALRQELQELHQQFLDLKRQFE